MRKALLLMLLLSSLSFSAGYGPSIIKLERVWTINGNGSYKFDGALAMNDSNQLVLQVFTDPPMVVAQGPDGSIRVRHNGSESSLHATAIVAVDFNTNITSDSPLVIRQLNATNLTAWTPGIENAAYNQEDNSSSLGTVLNLANFVHDYIEYNISYFGKVLPARDVFVQREGVCVEYSHLLISMARRLGLDTRFVSGYVNGGAWQPHAWVEITIPGYGKLPVDPTFGEVGELDNSHVAIGKGADQSDIYDRIESKGGMDVSVSDSAGFINESSDPKGLGIMDSFNSSSGVLEMTLDNSRQEYVYSTYELTLPDTLNLSERKVVLLQPGEIKKIDYQIDLSSFEPGYRYMIPLTAMLGDSTFSSVLVIETQSPQPAVPVAEQSWTKVCGPSLLLLGLFAAASFGFRGNAI